MSVLCYIYIVLTRLEERVCDWKHEGHDWEVELAQMNPEEEVDLAAELVGRAGEEEKLQPGNTD